MEKQKAQRKDMLALNKINNSKGLTLIELLAGIVIFSFISLFLFNIVTKAIETSNAIQMENQLRDEADIIMSKIFKTLYATKQSNILSLDPNGKYLTVTTDVSKCTKKPDGSWNLDIEPCKSTLKKIGFITEAATLKLQVLDEVYTSSNSVQILNMTNVKTDPSNASIYEFNLYLKITKKRGNQNYEKTLNFNNKIQAITLY